VLVEDHNVAQIFRVVGFKPFLMPYGSEQLGRKQESGASVVNSGTSAPSSKRRSLERRIASFERLHTADCGGSKFFHFFKDFRFRLQTASLRKNVRQVSGPTMVFGPCRNSSV